MTEFTTRDFREENLSGADVKVFLNIFIAENVVIEPDIEEESYKQILADMRFIKRRYGILPETHRLRKDDKQGLKGERMPFNDAVGAVGILREELGKYPPELIRNSGITNFRILETLTMEDIDEGVIGGVSFEDGDIYIANGEDPDYYRRTIHHEIRHRLDYQRYELKDKFPYMVWFDKLRESGMDRSWQELNKEYGKKYLGDGWRELDPETRPEGFARSYGTKNPREDRATISEDLMVDPGKLFDAMEGDELLRLKVEEMIRLYILDSRGVMNDNYFRDLANGEVNEGVWGDSGVRRVDLG